MTIHGELVFTSFQIMELSTYNAYYGHSVLAVLFFAGFFIFFFILFCFLDSATYADHSALLWH